MATYQQRAERILEGVLGNVPTPGQIQRAGIAFWRTDPWNQRPNLETEVPDPENPPAAAQAEVLVRNVHQMMHLQLQADSNSQAIVENEQILQDWKDSDLSDFPPPGEPA